MTVMRMGMAWTFLVVLACRGVLTCLEETSFQGEDQSQMGWCRGAWTLTYLVEVPSFLEVEQSCLVDLVDLHDAKVACSYRVVPSFQGGG